jgi:hypothetical protein
MRTPLRTIAAASMTALLAACSSSTEPRIDPEALASAAALDHIADSLFSAGVDGAVSSAYHDLANVVRSGAGVGSVVISVDGTPAEYFATAQSFDQNYCPPNAVCAMLYRPPLNSFVAWQKSNPRRVVQLITDGTSQTDIIYPAYPHPDRASLIYLDGAGGVFFGIPSTRGVTVAPTGEECAAPTAPPEASYVFPPVSCRRAEFTVSFTGTVQSMQVVRGNTATGTHTIDMAQTTVPGTLLAAAPGCTTCSLDAPPMRPPISIMGNSTQLLPGLRAAANGRDVTLTFTVTNTSAAPVQLQFNSGQQYDFVVRSATTGSIVWQWSADKGFITALTSRTLASGESAVYMEHFAAPAAGVYNAQAMLTSSSHRAGAATAFSVP